MSQAAVAYEELQIAGRQESWQKFKQLEIVITP
jgi:hypothetical protein